MRRKEIECREMTMCLGRDGSVRRRVKDGGGRKEEGARGARKKKEEVRGNRKGNGFRGVFLVVQLVGHL